MAASYIQYFPLDRQYVGGCRPVPHTSLPFTSAGKRTTQLSASLLVPSQPLIHGIFSPVLIQQTSSSDVEVSPGAAYMHPQSLIVARRLYVTDKNSLVILSHILRRYPYLAMTFTWCLHQTITAVGDQMLSLL